VHASIATAIIDIVLAYFSVKSSAITITSIGGDTINALTTVQAFVAHAIIDIVLAHIAIKSGKTPASVGIDPINAPTVHAFIARAIIDVVLAYFSVKSSAITITSVGGDTINAQTTV
jgi:hypothetical protein